MDYFEYRNGELFAEEVPVKRIAQEDEYKNSQGQRSDHRVVYREVVAHGVVDKTDH